MLATYAGCSPPLVTPSDSVHPYGHANGNVANINQLIGGENSSGFAALAQSDSNHDGVIDTNDPILTQRQVLSAVSPERRTLSTVCTLNEQS